MRSRLNKPTPPPVYQYECAACGVRQNAYGECDCPPPMVPCTGQRADA